MIAATFGDSRWTPVVILSSVVYTSRLWLHKWKFVMDRIKRFKRML
jgi:hypothetical protein